MVRAMTAPIDDSYVTIDKFIDSCIMHCFLKLLTAVHVYI